MCLLQHEARDRGKGKGKRMDGSGNEEQGEDGERKGEVSVSSSVLWVGVHKPL